MPAPTNFFAYVDAALLYGRLDTTLRPMLVMSAAFIPAINDYVDVNKLPAPEVVTKHLSPIVSSQRYERDGYVAESVGPVTLNQAAIGFGLPAAFWAMARQQRPVAAAPFRHYLLLIAARLRNMLLSLAKTCYSSRPMAILKKNAFSRRIPDLVTEELVAVLSRRASFEFKELFDIVHENLRARNAASGGEEMLRLRAYEKLQNLVARGAVKKNGKKYKGLPSALAKAIAPQNGHLAASVR